MQLVAPDILADVLRLSPGACLLGVLVGLAVWMTGWWKRAFWIALTVTVGFGLYGLAVASTHGTHPMAAALLLGLAAGLLSLELGRLIAFATGGLATAMALQAFVPKIPEPFLADRAGGLVCVLLFKLWTTTVLGFAGTLVASYGLLALFARWFKIDVITLANQKTGLLNVIIVAATAGSVVAQSRVEAFFTHFHSRRKAKVVSLMSEKEKAALSSAQKAGKGKLWSRFKPNNVA